MDGDLKTSLGRAVQDGDIYIVRSLLSQPIAVNTNSKSGTPLYQACRNGHTHIVQLLLSHGADATIKHKDKLPIEIATQGDHHKIVDILLTHDFKRQHASKALFCAAKNDSQNCLKLLCAHAQVEVNITDKKNKTPLHHYCKNSLDAEGVNIILSRSRKNINHQDCDGNTPLHIAFLYAKTSIIATLLHNEASTTIKNNKQLTATALGFENKKFDLIDNSLVQYMVLATDNCGNTQLHLYIASQDTSIASAYLQFLVQSGVSLWSRNKKGQTATELAHKEYCRTLKEYQRKPIGQNQQIFSLQEFMYHTFLRASSSQISCMAFKKMFEHWNLSPELQRHIMLYYYKINIETIIAKKYCFDHLYKGYYDKTFKQRKQIKQKLIAKPEKPHLLWMDMEQKINSLSNL